MCSRRIPRLLPVLASLSLWAVGLCPGVMAPGAAWAARRPGPPIKPLVFPDWGGAAAPAAATLPAEWATTMPVQATVPDPAKAVERTIDVNYRRAYVAEVVEDLEGRTGARIAFPAGLGDGWTFTFEAKGVTVKQVVEKLAGAGKFDLAMQGPILVLTQKADDAALAALGKQLSGGPPDGGDDRWERCRAAWALGQLADPRIYDLLIKALADKDAGVVDWTLCAFEKHSRMGCLLNKEQKAPVFAAIKKWMEQVEAQESQPGLMVDPMFVDVSRPNLWDRPAGVMGRCHHGRLDLAGSLDLSDSTAWLVRLLHQAKRPAVRCAAATALGRNRLAAGELLATLRYLSARTAEISKEIELGPDGKPADGDWPAYFKAQRGVEAVDGGRRHLILALWDIGVPEMAKVAQQALDHAPTAKRDIWIPIVAANEYQQRLELDVSRYVAARLAEIEKIYHDPPPDTPVLTPNGSAALQSPGPGGAAVQLQMAALDAIRKLAHVTDPAIPPAMLKLVKDNKLYPALCKWATWDQLFTFPAGDTAVIEALVARLSGKPAGPCVVAARSLGGHFDPAAAKGLTQALKDVEDDEVLGAVGRALGRTRDDQALAVLVDTAQSKREWTDLEKKDKAAGNMGMGATPHINARRLLVLGMIDSRDPGTFAKTRDFAADEKADADLGQMARFCLSRATNSAADETQAADLLKAANAQGQMDCLVGPQSLRLLWKLWDLPAVRRWSADDPRWVDLAKALAQDPRARVPLNMPGVPASIRINAVVDALAPLRTPPALKALVELCASDDAALLGQIRSALTTYHYTDSVAIKQANEDR